MSSIQYRASPETCPGICLGYEHCDEVSFEVSYRRTPSIDESGAECAHCGANTGPAPADLRSAEYSARVIFRRFAGPFSTFPIVFPLICVPLPFLSLAPDLCQHDGILSRSLLVGNVAGQLMVE